MWEEEEGEERKAGDGVGELVLYFDNGYLWRRTKRSCGCEGGEECTQVRPEAEPRDRKNRCGGIKRIFIFAACTQDAHTPLEEEEEGDSTALGGGVGLQHLRRNI